MFCIISGVFNHRNHYYLSDNGICPYLECVMKFIEKKKSRLIALPILALLCLKCSKDPMSVNHENNPPPIPTTTTQGPGGPAFMRGKLRDYLRPERSATNTHLYLMNQSNYTDTLFNVFVNSTDGSFLITELPIDTIDLIIVGTTFLSAKISSLILRSDHNSFHNLGPEGLWIDSTLFMVAIADSVPRPNMPQFGMLGYVNSLGVRFDLGIEQSEALRILGAFVYDTLQVYPDSLNGSLFYVIYEPNTNTLISPRLLYLNWRPEVLEAGPVIVVANHLNTHMLFGNEAVEMIRSR